jgi:hypothetical protein
VFGKFAALLEGEATDVWAHLESGRHPSLSEDLPLLKAERHGLAGGTIAEDARYAVRLQSLAVFGNGICV